MWGEGNSIHVIPLVVLEGGTAEAATTAVTLAGSVMEIWHAIERILTDLEPVKTSTPLIRLSHTHTHTHTHAHTHTHTHTFPSFLRRRLTLQYDDFFKSKSVLKQ